MLDITDTLRLAVVGGIVEFAVFCVSNAIAIWRRRISAQRNPMLRAIPKLPPSIADGAFHRLRFDWRPPSRTNAGSVTYYIDGAQVFQTRTNVPSLPAPLRIGVWFPQWWAGEPEFTEDAMEVDWVCISPFPAGTSP